MGPIEMLYFKVSWRKGGSEFPSEIYYEADDDGCVKRMIEIFVDGRVDRDAVSWHGAGDLPRMGSLVHRNLIDTLPDEEGLTTASVDKSEFDHWWAAG
jgi:hypothetical protein